MFAHSLGYLYINCVGYERIGICTYIRWSLYVCNTMYVTVYVHIPYKCLRAQNSREINSQDAFSQVK